eukprot:GHVL01017824.1.p1 GENE.GHVL01017824.1~~GHVL01017824.1.p1  ORF type:complete len:116 (-),score=6.70 GHVL01017824.1:806-1153(-)
MRTQYWCIYTDIYVCMHMILCFAQNYCVPLKCLKAVKCPIDAEELRTLAYHRYEFVETSLGSYTTHAIGIGINFLQPLCRVCVVHDPCQPNRDKHNQIPSLIPCVSPRADNIRTV